MRRTILATCFALLVIVGGGLLLRRGLKLFIITSQGMAPTYPAGALVITARVPHWELRINDVILFHPPGSHGWVAHRIVGWTTNKTGLRVMQTKGDANPMPDQWETTGGAVGGRVVLGIPGVGFAARVFQFPSIRLVILLAVLLVIISYGTNGSASLRKARISSSVEGGVSGLPSGDSSST